MTPESWAREFEAAVRAVREGAVLARLVQQSIGGRSFAKADESPVTVADFAVQGLIALRLREAFPDDPLVAEEDAGWLRTPAARPTRELALDVMRSALGTLAMDRMLDAIDRGRGTPGDRFWTLDPVDGTQGFLRGDQYVVALALIVKGRVEIGVLGCPALSAAELGGDGDGALVCAIRGLGAFRTPLTDGPLTRLRVSSRGEPGHARVLRSFESRHIDLDTFHRIIGGLGVETPPRAMDSQAKHAVVAAGHAELILRLPARRDYQEKIWDQAAGMLVIEEAGGRVTDLRGAALDFSAGRTLTRNDGVVASNGCLHARVLEVIRRLPLRQ